MIKKRLVLLLLGFVFLNISLINACPDFNSDNVVNEVDMGLLQGEFKDITIKDSLSASERLPGGFTSKVYDSQIRRVASRYDEIAGLSKEDLKFLMFLRGVEEGVGWDTLRKLDEKFDSIYFGSSTDIEQISIFTKISSDVDMKNPGFTNVYLLRDGAYLAEYRLVYDALLKRSPKVELLFMSRDTLSFTDPLREYGQFVVNKNKGYALLQDVYGMSASNLAKLGKEASRKQFYDSYFESFESKLSPTLKDGTKNPEYDERFVVMVESAHKQLEAEGLLNQKKLRFVDTCCMGTINMFLEGVIHHYHPEIETQSLLMKGGSDFLMNPKTQSNPGDAKAIAVEDLGKKGSYIGYNEEGIPKLGVNPHDYEGSPEQIALSYLHELLVVQSAVKAARGQ